MIDGALACEGFLAPGHSSVIVSEFLGLGSVFRTVDLSLQNPEARPKHNVFMESRSQMNVPVHSVTKSDARTS